MSSTKWILAAVAVATVIGQTCVAQDQSTTGVTVISTPAGADVTIAGDLIISGVTPVTFRHPLIGDYKLTVKKYGWETYSTRVTLDPGKATEINVRLSPKTRIKAATRSLVIPGWGQSYSGKKTKGYFLTLLAVTAVGAYLIADEDFDDKNKTFNNILRQYDSTATFGTISDLKWYKTRLDEAQDKAYDAENVRRLSIGAVVGVWSLAFLDAIFFFPEERGTFSVKGITINPTLEPQQFGLSFSKRF